MNKYRNKPTIVDNIAFHSKKEAARYAVLRLLELTKIISDLKLQVPFVIAPSVIINGRKKPALRYFADFVYIKDGQTIVEDVKGGPLTQVYIIKRHLLKSVLNIDILEI